MNRRYTVQLRVRFDEDMAVQLLNVLARANASRMAEQPDLPLLYDSGVVYSTESRERWSDVLHVYEAGSDDCDSLAAARAGELLARGTRALRPGDAGYNSQAVPSRIHAEVYLRTRTRPGEAGLYHCLVRYRIGGVWYTDDPSLRLGMGGEIDPHVLRRWKALGIR